MVAFFRFLVASSRHRAIKRSISLRICTKPFDGERWETLWKYFFKGSRAYVGTIARLIRFYQKKNCTVWMCVVSFLCFFQDEASNRCHKAIALFCLYIGKLDGTPTYVYFTRLKRSIRLNVRITPIERYFFLYFTLILINNVKKYTAMGLVSRYGSVYLSISFYHGPCPTSYHPCVYSLLYNAANIPT